MRFIGLLILLLSCEKPQKQQGISSQLGLQSDENFDTFYQNFYKDSTFQISRVIFHLEGYNQITNDLYNSTDGQNVKSHTNHYTQQKDWHFIMPPPIKNDKYDEEYKVALIKKKSFVIEKIWIDDSGFSIEKHFQLKDRKWYLVYFSYVDN